MRTLSISMEDLAWALVIAILVLIILLYNRVVLVPKNIVGFWRDSSYALYEIRQVDGVLHLIFFGKSEVIKISKPRYVRCAGRKRGWVDLSNRHISWGDDKWTKEGV